MGVSFGDFEVDLQTGELRKRGIRIKLQDQPFRVLEVLLERPGEVVSREDLRRRIWPDGTFVDYEQSLNKAVNKLRDALRDSAERPRYIETLPRRGYRFIGRVESSDSKPGAAKVNLKSEVGRDSAGHSLNGNHPNLAPQNLKEKSGSGALSGEVQPPARRSALSSARLVGAIAVVLLLGGWIAWNGLRLPAPTRSDWVQITNVPDSVSQPAFSPDGRMLTFIRGPGTFFTPGQVCVKMLPDGEIVQLTRDDSKKMSPVFSPNGSRIAYTVINEHSGWDTWVVPALGGAPRRWLPNASGLVWDHQGKLLFSEIIEGDGRMAIAAAEESRAGAKDTYVPPGERGMAHRSYPSPDGRWVLVVEMDTAVWLPCRLVPADGSSPGRPVGPPLAGCTFAAWSPDGEWMYLNSGAGGAFHIWRQHLPDGKPEQITSGPTQEEGIAMAPDGRSFITSVGLKDAAVWVHDSSGEREVSLEGYAYEPRFTPDGERLCYRILKGTGPMLNAQTELWMVDLDSGHNAPLLPGFSIVGVMAYDIARDSGQVVAAAQDREGKSRLWLAPPGRESPPWQIPDVEGEQPMFGANGTIFFRALEGNSLFTFSVQQDGTGLRKVSERGLEPRSVSPDGQWLVLVSRGEEGTRAFPVGGGPPVTILRGDDARLRWSPDGRLVFLSVGRVAMGSGIAGHTYVLRLSPGQVLPTVPDGGFRSEAEIARMPGVRVIDSYDVAPGPKPEVYAFSRETVQRNLYRIPVP